MDCSWPRGTCPPRTGPLAVTGTTHSVLPDGALWVVTGDVAGHGLHAAVVMGRVKSALRAYALLGEGPAHVLELTDRKVEHFEFGAMVTIVCARAHPPFADWTISSSRAPASDSGSARGADDPWPPFRRAHRWGPCRERRERGHALEVPPGGLILLYTDGLVERRDEIIDAGLQRPAGRGALWLIPRLVSREVMQHLVGSRHSARRHRAACPQARSVTCRRRAAGGGF